MEEKEFNEQVSTIEMIKQQTIAAKKNIETNAGNYLVNSVNTLLNNINNRDAKFSEYLNQLKEFNFSDSLTSPTDLFPGIRTVSDMVDPDELRKKTQAMKETALFIETKNKEIETLSNNILNSLKASIKSLTELMIQENQIYDLSMDVLNDLDSIYDVGQLKSSTK